MAEITDDHVVLLEETLQKNRDVLTENEKLQAELKAREESHSRVLQEVLKELQNLKESQRTAPAGNRRHSPQENRKKQKLQVPKSCRVSILPLSYLILPVNFMNHNA